MNVSRLHRPSDVTPLRASLACLAVLAAATASIAFAPAAADAISAAVTSVACTGSSTCVSGANNGGGIGVSGTSPKGIGVRGQSTSSFGLYGYSKTGIALKAISASSTGVLAVSTSGNGVIGSTASTDTYVPHAGLTGSDLADGNGLNVGVLGATNNGGFGVQGVSQAGAYGGVQGLATSGVGVEGISQTSYGVDGVSESGPGVAGTSYSGDAVDAISTGDGQNPGLYAENSGGEALVAEGQSMALVGNSPSFPLVLTDDSGHEELYVTGAGNVYVHGSYNTFVTGRNGATTTAFTSRSAAPTVEDTGTAQLVRGSAAVAFDPAFAASIDADATYRVLLTPSGDTRGLFVASKTPTGFLVRETQGGRGTIAFDYRIVATAPGQKQRRMAFIDPHGPAMPHPARHPNLRTSMLHRKKAASR